jgi:hypothetical protein
MLKRPEGATIEQIVAATGWQPHTVRGAFAGALKKRLGITVNSEKVDGRGRVYRIARSTRLRTLPEAGLHKGQPSQFQRGPSPRWRCGLALKAATRRTSVRGNERGWEMLSELWAIVRVHVETLRQYRSAVVTAEALV